MILTRSGLKEKKGLLFTETEGPERLACYREYRSADLQTGIEYLDCRIDYTCCPNKKCIKKLV